LFAKFSAKIFVTIAIDQSGLAVSTHSKFIRIHQQKLDQSKIESTNFIQKNPNSTFLILFHDKFAHKKSKLEACLGYEKYLKVQFNSNIFSCLGLNLLELNCIRNLRFLIVQ
jgi:tRNA 2-selenouridine synthase SelU